MHDTAKLYFFLINRSKYLMVLVHRRYEPCIIYTRASGCTSVCSHDHVYVHCITGHSIEIAASVKAQSNSKMCTCSRLVRACAHFLYRTIDHCSLPLLLSHDVIIVSALTTQTQAQLPACKTSPCLFRFTYMYANNDVPFHANSSQA